MKRAFFEELDSFQVVASLDFEIIVREGLELLKDMGGKKILRFPSPEKADEFYRSFCYGYLQIFWEDNFENFPIRQLDMDGKSDFGYLCTTKEGMRTIERYLQHLN